jgi:hypothetical protein
MCTWLQEYFCTYVYLFMQNIGKLGINICRNVLTLRHNHSFGNVQIAEGGNTSIKIAELCFCENTFFYLFIYLLFFFLLLDSCIFLNGT